MKQNERDMFYSDYNYGSFTSPPMAPNMYAGSQMSVGSNMFMQPNMQNNNTMMPNPNMGAYSPNEYMDNSLEQRVSRCERQIKALNNKVVKLENDLNQAGINDIEVNSNMYML